MSYENLPSMIWEARKKRGLTQEQLGDILNVSGSVIGKVEATTEYNINFHLLLKLCQELDIRVNFYPGKFNLPE